MKPIIELKDVEVTFRSRTGSLFKPHLVRAVQGVNMQLVPGQTLGLVGESGCGKSTTAKVMCGLQAPTAGKVFFQGDEVTKRSAHDRKLIGRVVSVVFQDPATALNALSLQPNAIIADEPTSALDVSVRAQILNLLTDLKQELGLAMVFISHDIQTVRYVSDRIAVMNGGKVVEQGEARELLANPKDPYTRTLLGAAPSLLHPDLSAYGKDQ